jgi:cytochrome b6-f complex iron-sulfur subunit
MSPNEPTRRCFLKVIAAAAIVPTTFACSSASSGGSPVAFGTVTAGTVSALSVGSLNAVSGTPVCIGRDAQGVYAMTLTCTHEGCDMGTQGSVSSSGIVCDCHGSKFDVDGNVTQGPATTALQHYAVTADATGTLTIHGDQSVASSVRLVD